MPTKTGTGRAAVYARFSSENQRDAWIDDQIEVCRRYVSQHGWHEVAVYEDRAISGASRFRHGFQQLLADAEAKRFDILVCESIDRLGRRLSDVADLYDRLAFFGIEIHATAVGHVTQMHMGIMGTMAQMTLTDLRAKTLRGQLGRARAGCIPGGLAYGYEVVPPPGGSTEAGQRRIVDAEAVVVRRIFTEYANGKSPRHIARDLNAEGIPGPRGRPWGDTTIRGQADRGTGVLNNPVYIGQLTWNRCSYIKDPRTGRRLARVNPVDRREEIAVPHLRIVDQAQWQQARNRRADLHFTIVRDASGNALNRAHRRHFLLSGLLVCGCCGGGYTVMGKDRYGCAARRIKGTCDNGRTIMRQRIEQRVLSGLKERLLAPELVAEFVRAFANEMAAAQRHAASEQTRLHEQLADVERRLAGVVRAVENGSWSETLNKRLVELEARKSALLRQQAEAGRPAPIVQLHPNAAAIYRRRVADLEQELNAPDARVEASGALRDLIERVVLTPDDGAPDRMCVELYGDLAEILALCPSARQRPSQAKGKIRADELARTAAYRCQLSVVAGARNHLNLLPFGPGGI